MNKASFAQRLEYAWTTSESLVCVGLDPDLERIPAQFRTEEHPFFAFNREVIDATHDLVCAYKPQGAFYSAVGAETDLALTIKYIRERAPHALVILDVKRSDIGNTAKAYAQEAFVRYGADAATINPYMGDDSVFPFIQRSEYGAIVLCRTSNSGAKDFQDLIVNGIPLYQYIAQHAASRWNTLKNMLLVVGATYPQEMGVLRQAHPEIPFLVPGIGQQGGDLEATLSAGLDSRGRGLLISSSRAIIYAGDGSAAAIRAAAMELRDLINDIRRDQRKAKF